jgi:hypothetical protein
MEPTFIPPSSFGALGWPLLNVHAITADTDGDATALMENVGHHRQFLDKRRIQRRDLAKNAKQALSIPISIISLRIDINHHLGQRRHERAIVDA